MRLLIRWAITAVALVIASRLVPGVVITGQSGWIAVLVMAVALGLVNAVVRPLLKLLSCGLIVLTLGLFTFVINALCLWLAAWVAQNVFGAGFVIESFGAAFWASIVVSVVSFVLSIFLSDDDD